jgi:hypothetical protein
MGILADLDTQRFAKQMLERRRMPAGGPQLELRVAARSHLQQGIVAAIVEVEARDGL